MRDDKYLLVALLIIISLIVSAGFITGLTWIICWAFSITFTWKYAVGAWAILFAINLLFNNNNSRRRGETI